MAKEHSWSAPSGFLGVPAAENPRFSILPVPFDSTASYRGGARNGPAAIAEASRQVELYDIEAGREIVPEIETLEPLEAARTSPEENVKRVRDIVSKLLAAGRIPVLIGGDHSVTIGAVLALPKDVVVISIDAHGDLRDEYEGSKFSHACVMKRAFDSGHRIMEFGVRAISKEEAGLIAKNPARIRVAFADDIRRDGMGKVARQLAKEITGRKVYLTIDIDGFDPKEAPGTGTPEPGGLSYAEGLEIIRTICAKADVVGFDVMEVSPTGTDNVTEFLAAKLIFRIMGYLG